MPENSQIAALENKIRNLENRNKHICEDAEIMLKALNRLGPYLTFDGDTQCPICAGWNSKHDKRCNYRLVLSSYPEADDA